VVTHPGTARALVCDATACRILYAGREFLDLGRTVRVVPPALRRVVIARDRHCVWPGCDRRPALCDVHRLVHWVNGGPTDLGNLVLLCRRHHTMLYQAGFGIHHAEGEGLVFTRPDGSIIQHRGPPGLAA